MDCVGLDVLNDTFLPDTNFSMTRRLEIGGCPLPKNGFTYLVRKFSLLNLEKLFFTILDLKENLTSEDLQDMKNLQVLELKGINESVIDGKIFKYTPELSQLRIDRIKLNFDDELFKYIPKLSILEVSNNNIYRIPKNALRYLQLNKLIMWGNKMNLLANGDFDTMWNLKMLELNLNEIEEIEDGAFDQLTNLTSLNLYKNRLKQISRRIFQNLGQLAVIRMNGNPNINLIDDVFSNFTKLRNIDLSYNRLQNLSENLFKGSTNLVTISLNNNQLKTLPHKIFEYQKNLKSLHLHYNKIENIDPEVFESLEKLEYLNLYHNNLETIHERLLENLKMLKEINLSYNKIIKLPVQCLSGNKNLLKFLMSHNQFNFEEPTAFGDNTPFSSMSSTNMKEVDLSFNKITRYPSNLNKIATVNVINLKHNHIKEIFLDELTTINAESLNVDLSSNDISSIHIWDLNFSQPYNDRIRTYIEISNNPIICDCQALNLARYARENTLIEKNLVMQKEQLICAGPQKLFNQPLDTVNLEELVCKLVLNNTTPCDYLYRPLDDVLVFNCSGRMLTEVPKFEKYNYPNSMQTEIHLEDNRLEQGPGEFDGYQDTFKWYLRGNAIRNITWIPSSLKVLDIRENKLETIDSQALKMINESKLEKFYLGSNPWKCDCDQKDFLVYLKDHIDQIDMSNIRCYRTSRRLGDLNDKDICPEEAAIILNITVVVLFCLFIITSAISLYFFYQKEILIWLYGRGYCLWLVKEEELDKDKIYDAFISFSNKDEDFVIDNLVSVLESGQEPYRLNIHFRDWIPGELIQTQIINSVRDSRRTIVVLSANFLESVWGIVEFKTAHNEAMREGRARVVIIICGDIDIEALDDDLKAYLKTNTYIKWGDPWFWDKLKYALPKRTGRQVLSKKHANMMQFIDDKFILVDKQPTHSVSTPVILSPKELEGKSLTCIA